MFDLDYKKVSQNITDWLRQTVTTSGFEKLVIGVSGGVDSSVAAALAVQSIAKENVYLVLLPYGKYGRDHVQDAKLVAKFLKIPEKQIFVIDIKKAVDVIASRNPPAPFTKGGVPQDGGFSVRNDNAVRRGNIMARVRM